MKKRNVRRRWFILALVGVGVLSVFYFDRTSAPVALPNPNGYDELLKASQAIIGNFDDFRNLEHDDLRALVATNEEALRLMRAGMAHPYVVPTELEIVNVGVMGPELPGIKKLVRVLSAEGRLAELENHPAEAARSYLEMIRLGSMTSRGGFIIHRLVGVACEAMGCSSLVQIIPKLNCEQIRSVAAELEQIDKNSVPWTEVMQNENRFARARMGSFPNPIKLIASWSQARSVRRSSETRHNLAAAHLRLITLELALRSYQCDLGHGPENLGQLVPKHLHRLPLDPFGGKSLVYRPVGTNWLIYSLGPDRVDDGGKPMGRFVSGGDPFGFGESGPGANKGDLRYDSGW